MAGASDRVIVNRGTLTPGSSGKHKLAVVATHPIQYQVPFWRAISQSGRFDLHVYYATRHGLEPREDPGFGKTFAWDIPLTDGYEHEFLKSRALPFLSGPVANRFPIGLGRIFRSQRFDAVLVNGYASGASLAAILAAWKTGAQVIMRGDTHAKAGRGSWRTVVKKIILPSLLRRVDGFLAIGKWNRNYWLSFGVPAERIVTSVYAVDNEFFTRRLTEDPAAPGRLRAGWGAAPRDVVFLYCAKLIPVKAPGDLLRAFGRLPSQARAHLVFVGSGELMEALKKSTEELGLRNVHWIGFVNQSDIPFYYKSADVLVLPSRVEPWGLVVNEAMASGTPCIVSDACGAAPELVERCNTGIVFPAGDVSSLASAMLAALDPPLRESWMRSLSSALEPATLENSVTGLSTLLEGPVGPLKEPVSC
jgi:glycosyltransferase involved in cell wall biosynthesis